MKNKIKFISFFVVMVLFSSCTYKGMYYYGNYSNTLYSLKKEPTKENIENHTNELKRIIDFSIENNISIPPGIYCEYGYQLKARGLNEEAKKNFLLEKKVYPSSSMLIDRIVKQLNSGGK